MQGHIELAPSGSGAVIPALSPPMPDQSSSFVRTPVHLTGINFNGVLHAIGTITLSGGVRIYGAALVGETIVRSDSGSSLEVWYDHDLGEGLFRGLPVVYRAPGTWMARF
jgi:hypothetical protein